MKTIYTIIFISLLFNLNIIGQQLIEKKDSIDSFIIGFNAGSLFSKFYPGRTDPSPSDTMTYENKFKTGLTAGLFLYPQTKHFGIRLEINYYYIQHRIKYHSSSRSPGGSSFTKADYFINSSIVRISFLPTISFGNKIKSYFFFGPNFIKPIYSSKKGQIDITGSNMLIPNGYSNSIRDNEINNSLNNTLGILLGIGIKKSFKNDYIGIELITGKTINNILDYPSMNEHYATINIVYLFELK